MYKCPILFFLLWANGMFLFAQNKPTSILSKQEAISTLLETNFGVKIVKNQANIAANNQKLLNSGYLPNIFTQAGASIEETDSKTDFNGARREDGTLRENIEINDATTKRYNASLNLEYTLFDGLGRYYNLRQLKEQYNLSELQAREVIENTILQLFSVYYEVARLEENSAVLKEALEISKKRKIRAQYQFDYGQVNKLQILNAQVDITTDHINLLNLQQQLKNTQRDLNVILNRDLKDLVTCDTTVAFINPLKMDSFLDKAPKNNVNLLQAEQENIINAYQVKSAKSSFLPTIGLTGSYGWNQSDNPASAFFPSTTRSNVTLSAGTSLRWNLFDGGRSLTILKNAKIFKENQELALERLKAEVERDIANAKGNYANALKIYEMQTQNVLTNTDNFKRSQERLKLGQITSVEFRQAQLNLLNAKTTKNAAKYTAKLAELQLLQLTGQLLNIAKAF